MFELFLFSLILKRQLQSASHMQKEHRAPRKQETKPAPNQTERCVLVFTLFNNMVCLCFNNDESANDINLNKYYNNVFFL